LKICFFIVELICYNIFSEATVTLQYALKSNEMDLDAHFCALYIQHSVLAPFCESAVLPQEMPTDLVERVETAIEELQQTQRADCLRSFPTAALVNTYVSQVMLSTVPRSILELISNHRAREIAAALVTVLRMLIEHGARISATTIVNLARLQALHGDLRLFEQFIEPMAAALQVRLDGSYQRHKIAACTRHLNRLRTQLGQHKVDTPQHRQASEQLTSAISVCRSAVHRSEAALRAFREPCTSALLLEWFRFWAPLDSARCGNVLLNPLLAWNADRTDAKHAVCGFDHLNCVLMHWDGDAAQARALVERFQQSNPSGAVNWRSTELLARLTS
jgi:hypothetical protein